MVPPLFLGSRLIPLGIDVLIPPVFRTVRVRTLLQFSPKPKFIDRPFSAIGTMDEKRHKPKEKAFEIFDLTYGERVPPAGPPLHDIKLPTPVS
jgi:hypothetical protein